MISAAEQGRPSLRFSLSFLNTVIINEYTRMCVGVRPHMCTRTQTHMITNHVLQMDYRPSSHKLSRIANDEAFRT